MGIHDGHRNNIRKSFIQTGLKGKTEHQALELLLTYALPRIDVNPIAHELINKFGNLEGVINASYEELESVSHITENVAVLIKLIPEIYKMYRISRWQTKKRFRSLDEIADYFAPFLRDEKLEHMYLMCLDGNLSMLDFSEISSGGTFETEVNLRKIVDTALRTKATAIVLAHNHPSGNAQPSEQDISSTKIIERALYEINVYPIEHLIFTNNETSRIINKFES